jgi:hypothetical protein
MDEVSLGLTEVAWNIGSQLWPDWNGLEWKKVSFGLTGIDWNGGS